MGLSRSSVILTDMCRIVDSNKSNPSMICYDARVIIVSQQISFTLDKCIIVSFMIVFSGHNTKLFEKCPGLNSTQLLLVSNYKDFYFQLTGILIGRAREGKEGLFPEINPIHLLCLVSTNVCCYLSISTLYTDHIP